MRATPHQQMQTKPPIFSRALALLLIVLLGIAPTSSAMWQCEGRICGVSAWACCCLLPKAANTNEIPCDEQAITRTAHLQTAAHQAEVGPCTVDCHCTMMVRDRGAALHPSPHNFIAPIIQIAVLPPAFELQAPVRISASRPLPSRGPPPTSSLYASPSLRAPPVA
jgi:hypothetical protein